MKKFLITAALAATSLTGVAVAAQQQNASAARHHFGADANQDGVTTRDEAIAAADARFARQDADKDGQLSADEMGRHHKGMRGHHRKHGGKWMKRLDTDGDGQLSDAEKQAARARMTARLDSDGDGTVSAEEKQTARAKWQEHRGKRGGGKMHARMIERFDADKDGTLSDAEKQAAKAQFEARRDKMRAAMVAKRDTDKNGSIGQAEFRAAAVERFDRIDANKDGRIDRSEREALHAKVKQRFEQKRAERAAQSQ